MSRNHRKALRGIDNRPGLKLIGKLDEQARERDIREGRQRQWSAVDAEIKARQYTAVNAGKGHTIMFGAMPMREQRRLAIAALNKRVAA